MLSLAAGICVFLAGIVVLLAVNVLLTRRPAPCGGALQLPILMLSICDGRWGRYSVPHAGAPIAARMRANATRYPLAKVIVHSEDDIPAYRDYEKYRWAWSTNFMDAGHIQKHLFLLEHAALIRAWPGLVLYQDCKNGDLGHDANFARVPELLGYLDAAGGVLVANQPYKHRAYCPHDCWTAMGRDGASPAYDTECQIRAAWILFRPEHLDIIEAVVAELTHGHPACKTNGDALYKDKEMGRGDQTVLHNLLYRDGRGRQLSAYSSEGVMENSVLFFDYTRPDWRLALEQPRC